MNRRRSPTRNITRCRLTAEKRYSNGLQFLASFVWSKSMDDASAPDDNTTWLGSFSSLVDPNKPWLERSLSTFDIPVCLPIQLHLRSAGGTRQGVPGQYAGAAGCDCGRMEDQRRLAHLPTAGRLPSFTYDGTSLPTYGGQRPNIVGRPRAPKGPTPSWINNYFANPRRFPAAADLRIRQCSAGHWEWSALASAFNTNMSVEKEFSLSKLHEGMNFELRLEAENALNHPVFGTPDTSVDDPNFGVISYTSNGPRQVQLGGKINF